MFSRDWHGPALVRIVVKSSPLACALVVVVLCATAGDAVAGDWLEAVLLNTAVDEHRAAVAKRAAWDSGGRVDEKLHREALAAYDQARQGYERFLATFPQSELAYQTRYQLAEDLYFSGHFLESIPHYRWVRDHRDPRALDLTVDAARSVLSAYEGACPIEPPNLDSFAALPRPVAPLAMPRCHISMMAAYAEYARLMPGDAYAPAMALNAALVAIAYVQLDEAAAQLRALQASFPSSEQARTSRNLLLIVEGMRTTKPVRSVK